MSLLHDKGFAWCRSLWFLHKRTEDGQPDLGSNKLVLRSDHILRLEVGFVFGCNFCIFGDRHEEIVVSALPQCQRERISTITQFEQFIFQCLRVDYGRDPLFGDHEPRIQKLLDVLCSMPRPGGFGQSQGLCAAQCERSPLCDQGITVCRRNQSCNYGNPGRTNPALVLKSRLQIDRAVAPTPLLGHRLAVRRCLSPVCRKSLTLSRIDRMLSHHLGCNVQGVLCPFDATPRPNPSFHLSSVPLT